MGLACLQDSRRKMVIRTLTHPEAGKTEEQHHNARLACTLFLLTMHGLLFELWGSNTLLDLAEASRVLAELIVATALGFTAP
jgi:hypothetical protein